MDAPLTGNLNNGFLGSFLSNSLKTTQLEVNTDAKTLRPIARLKEPRDLFALPKDRDNECPQQAARWPTECQVLDERIFHIDTVPETPEPYYKPTGHELQPRPVGEENGVVVYCYNPISAVNYIGDYNSNIKSKQDDCSSSSDDSSRSSTPLLKNLSESKENDSLEHENILEYEPNIFTDNSEDDEDDSEITGIKLKRTLFTNFRRSLTPIPLIAHSKLENIANTIDNDLPIPFLNICPQFSRSSVGGSKYLLNVHPNPPENDDLLFESRFESGNLAKAVKITSSYYELYLRPDLYTSRHTQWFYFRVMNTKKGMSYRFSIVNLVKSDSLYNEGMRPLMYSTIEANNSKIGWRRCGDNISYFKNDEIQPNNEEEDDYGSYTLTFNIDFKHENDTVFFAHSYPYTYSELQDYLMEIQRNPIKSNFCKLRLLCRSLAGNNVYYLTVTAPPTDEENQKKKKAVVVSARVHPGETPSSWMMKGFMDFITGDSFVAKKLRHKFIFKLIPMLNPDGVIVGNTRNSLTGKDLNRQYRTVIRETYPSIWYTKAMIKRLMEECGVVMYCDMHAHSRKHNIFIYGCENRRMPDKRLIEQVFPLMLHKNVADKFSFENCKFKVQRNKEGTGRIVVWMLGITNSYTMEASFGGTTMGARAGTHFSTLDYEHLGRAFCETLMDYHDENPLKEKLRSKILTRLEQEGSNADEPQNIPLSDYSSDEGDTSSSSDNEGKTSEFEGPCCQPLKVPPSSPVFPTKQLKHNRRSKKIKPKVRRSESYKSKNVVRQILEIPTTDMGGDFFQYGITSADDDSDIDDYDIYWRTHRSSRMESIRKSTPLSYEIIREMPPELIIKSAKKKSEEIYLSSNESKDRSDRLKPNTTNTEFPPINAGRRTKSWHNFNRCVPNNIKNPNLQEINYENNDSLQMKLSLKKKIWTGAYNDYNSNRPLSWGIPALMKVPYYDYDALLEACSRKLTVWQDGIDDEKYGDIRNTPVKSVQSSHLVFRAQMKSADIIGHRRSSIKLKSARNETKITLTQPTPPSSSVATSQQSSKEKKKPKVNLGKLVQTTEIITRLAKSSFKQATPKKNSTTQSSTLSSSTTASGKTAKTPNKFKTGGIVATAVQNKKIKKNLRAATAIPSGIKKSLDSETDSENVKIFVRKVKTKMKRKKSKS